MYVHITDNVMGIQLSWHDFVTFINSYNLIFVFFLNINLNYYQLHVLVTDLVKLVAYGQIYFQLCTHTPFFQAVIYTKHPPPLHYNAPAKNMYHHLSVQTIWDWARRSILLPSNQTRLWLF